MIILTSNIGSDYLDHPVITDEMRDQVMAVGRSTIRPEFLNRLDEVIMFLPLTPEQLRQIMDLLLKKEVKLLAAQGVTLAVSEAAIVWMLAQNDHPEWGARPLRRILQKNLREPLADWILTTASAEGRQGGGGRGRRGLVFSY